MSEHLYYITEMIAKIEGIVADLQKAGDDNSAAARRSRVALIEFAKMAKKYRKESISYYKKSSKPWKKVAKKDLKE